jgi:hypothetical protein
VEPFWGSLKAFRGEDVHNAPALHWRVLSQEIACEQGPRGLRICGATSDNGHYVTLARRVFPGVRTLAYGQTATVRGEASEVLCCLMYSVRCTRQDAPLPLSALDFLKQRTDALLLGG